MFKSFSKRILKRYFTELSTFTSLSLLQARREERGPVERSGGHPVPPLLLGLWRLELRHRHVGGHVLWRKTLLGHGQPGCKCVRDRMVLCINLAFVFLPLPHFYFLFPLSMNCVSWILLKESQEVRVTLKAFTRPNPPLFKSASAPWPILFSLKDALTPSSTGLLLSPIMVKKEKGNKILPFCYEM